MDWVFFPGHPPDSLLDCELVNLEAKPKQATEHCLQCFKVCLLSEMSCEAVCLNDICIMLPHVVSVDLTFS